MTGLAWFQDGTGWTAPAPLDVSSGKHTAELMASLHPSRRPSGINGLQLADGDHIAVFILEETALYHELLLDFTVAGIRDSRRTEQLSLELSQGTSAPTVRERLAARLAGEVPSRVDVIDWDRNSGDYEPQHFTRTGMHSAMAQEAERLRGAPGSVLRVASEDCSKFMLWLSNPKDYLLYEYELADDLAIQIGSRGFIQMCGFHLKTLDETFRPHGLSLFMTTAHLIASHSHCITVDREEILCGRAAERRLAECVTTGTGRRPSVLRLKLCVALLRLWSTVKRTRQHRGEPIISPAGRHRGGSPSDH